MTANLLLRTSGWRPLSSLRCRLHSSALGPPLVPARLPIRCGFLPFHHTTCNYAGSMMHRFKVKHCAYVPGCRSATRTLQTTSHCGSFHIHEIADALSQHPGIAAATGTGGIGLLASTLYRSPALWKLIAKASDDKSILLLPQKPSHSFQSRKRDVRRLQSMFKSLRKQNRGNVAVAVYITGRPCFGKTQLAREFGNTYYQRNKGFFFKNLFVGTLNASSKHTFLQSYVTLALELGCGAELKAIENFSGKKGELQSLELLSAAVRRELKHRPGWLLVVDNLSSDVKPVGEAQTIETFPVVTPSSLPYSPHGIGRERLEMGGAWGVAAAHGVDNARAAWSLLWPQPGDEGWGKGYVLVTTRDRRLVERSCPSATELYLSEGMGTQDAVALLEKVSGLRGDGAMEVVNTLEMVPLSIASAGFYIHAEKSRNPSYSFRDYLSGLELEQGIQEEGEKMLQSQNTSYPVTMTTAVSMATRELSADPSLHKVFVLLAACAQSPVPLSLIARVLGIRPDINSTALEAVRSCVLLFFPSRAHQEGGGTPREPTILTEDIETVSLYAGTRNVFRKLLLGDRAVSQAAHSEVLPARPAHDSVAVQERNELFRHFIDCLVREYEAASDSESVSSYRLRYLLLPHMEALLQAPSVIPGFRFDINREVRLCSSLGSVYLLVGRPTRAREVLERALRVTEDNGGKRSLEAAAIASKLGTTYRHLAMQQESKRVLQEALSVYKELCGEDSIEVAYTLNNLSSTHNHLGQYEESRLCLERALSVYEQLDSFHPSVAIALTNLGAAWRNLGDSLKSKELFEKALAIQEQLYEPYHPSIAVTLGNLSVSYLDLGQSQKSIEFLQRALQIGRHVHGPDHISVAITLSNLSVAYRHLGNVRKSQELAKEALRKTEAIHGPAHPDVAIALGILGSTYSDLGEMAKAQELLETSVKIKQDINGPRHIRTAIAQAQLGRVTRLAGDLQSARDILETALETKELFHGRDHPGIEMTLNSLGKVYHELGYLTQSQYCLLRSQGIVQKLYCSNPSHPQIAFHEADLARVVRDCGDLEKSVALMQHAIDLYRSTIDESTDLGYSESHPKYASMLAVMGLIRRDLGELKEARKLLERALRIQEGILSQENLMIARTMGNLGTVLHRLGDRNRALECLNSALSMMRSVKYEHPITATVSAAIARLRLDLGDVHSARASLEEALKIRMRCCGGLHPNVALYHKLLGSMMLKEGADDVACQHFQRACLIYGRLCVREERLSDEGGMELPVLREWRGNMDDLDAEIQRYN